MRQTAAEKSVRYPKIEGKRWELAWSFDTKAEAQSRAANIRRFIKGRARVRRIPDSSQRVIGTRLGKWGVYTP